MGKTRSNLRSVEKAARQLAQLFARNGCLRLPNIRRRKIEKRQYHAGYEVRLVASDEEELNLVRSCLRAVELRPGREFTKVNKFVLPIYGKAQVEHFCSVVKALLPPAVVARKIRK